MPCFDTFVSLHMHFPLCKVLSLSLVWVVNQPLTCQLRDRSLWWLGSSHWVWAYMELTEPGWAGCGRRMVVLLVSSTGRNHPSSSIDWEHALSLPEEPCFSGCPWTGGWQKEPADITMNISYFEIYIHIYILGDSLMWLGEKNQRGPYLVHDLRGSLWARPWASDDAYLSVLQQPCVLNGGKWKLILTRSIYLKHSQPCLAYRKCSLEWYWLLLYHRYDCL